MKNNIFLSYFWLEKKKMHCRLWGGGELAVEAVNCDIR